MSVVGASNVVEDVSAMAVIEYSRCLRMGKLANALKVTSTIHRINKSESLEDIMASPAVAPIVVDLKKTEECTFVTIHFHMGIGTMRQVKNLKAETTADPSQLR